MNSETDPSKRIPKSVGTDTQILGRYSLTDLVVGGLPGVLVVIIAQVFLPESMDLLGFTPSDLAIPLAALGVIIGFLFVYLTPNYTSSLDWFLQFIRFHHREKELPHTDAREYTGIKELFPEHGVIQRTDGAVVGALYVDPVSMALATEEEWEKKSREFEDFVNTSVNYPLQIYSTTRDFPTESYLQNYTERLTDQDVQSNEDLKNLILEYVEWYRGEMSRRQMSIRDHYVVVPVSPAEARFERTGIKKKIVRLPIIGVVVQALSSPPRAVEKALLVNELDERLKAVERALRDIEGLDAGRLSAEELAAVTEEFWTGKNTDKDAFRERVRNTPFVGGEQE